MYYDVDLVMVISAILPRDLLAMRCVSCFAGALEFSTYKGQLFLQVERHVSEMAWWASYSGDVLSAKGVAIKRKDRTREAKTNYFDRAR